MPCKHIDDLRLLHNYLRKEFISHCETAHLMVSRKDVESVIDALLPKIIRMVNK